MYERTAEAGWRGTLAEGSGVMKVGSGALEGRYSFGSRFGEASGTNPEELIGAAHAGCFSMALALELGREGFKPQSIHTRAKVDIEQARGGFKITHIYLETDAVVPGINDMKFRELCELAKRGCPVSQALAGTTIGISAHLASSRTGG